MEIVLFSTRAFLYLSKDYNIIIMKMITLHRRRVPSLECSETEAHVTQKFRHNNNNILLRFKYYYILYYIKCTK